jgi:hypothetical protein
MRTRWLWLWLLLGQALVVSILTVLALVLLAADPNAAGVAYGIMMWAVVPLAGALTAFLPSERVSSASRRLAAANPSDSHPLADRGVSAALGWDAADSGAYAIVGAAAGEEWNRRKKKRARRGKK